MSRLRRINSKIQRVDTDGTLAMTFLGLRTFPSPVSSDWRDFPHSLCPWQPFTSQRPLPIIAQYPVAQHFRGGIFGTVLGFSVLHMSALLAGLRSVRYRFPREASSPCVLQPWYTTLLCTSLNCHIGTMSSLFICSVRTWHRGSRVQHPLLHNLGIRTEGAGQT